jgi:hypothetical protein
MGWYSIVSNDVSKLDSCIVFYEKELENLRKDTSIKGNLEQNQARLPGITEVAFSQLQEIEAILKFLELQYTCIHKKHYQKYLEGYNRQLSSRDAEKYSDAEDEVIQYSLIINETALIRNKYLGIIKALEQKSFMLGNISRLRAAGMEDASI